MRPIAAAARAWRASIGTRRRLGLAISYPHYLELHRQLAPERLIYYNMDDYAFYWRAHAARIRQLESEAVARADLSIACARLRADALAAAAVPEAAGRVIHLPHGAPAEAIAAQPMHAPAPAPADLAVYPRPYLGFVGSLEERVDWHLIAELARATPTGTVVLIGRPPALPRNAPWTDACRRALALPNVAQLGWREQSQLASYTAAFDVALIPYDVTCHLSIQLGLVPDQAHGLHGVDASGGHYRPARMPAACRCVRRR
jgi:glycosyltransferase involved in cell wall biosynthesis